MTVQPHQFHRHPALPWAELRVSRQSCYSYRLHAHAQYSIGIVDEGETLFLHDDGPETLSAGSVVLIEPGVWHACNPAQVAAWSYRMLYVQADWLHAQLGVAGLRFVQRARHDAATTAAVQRLCQTLLEGDAAAWTQALTALLRQPAIAHPLAAPPALPASDAAVHHALQRLHRQPDATPSVQDLARAEGMSASRFIRHFKAATGVTPGAYRLNLRLNGARRLLAEGAALADAAHAMGFADQAHLQRAFKAHHALTPGRYAQGARA